MPFLPPECRAVYRSNIEDALPRAWLGDDQVIGEAELGERQPGAVGEGVGPEGGGGGSSEDWNIVQPFPQLACSVNTDIFRLDYILILLEIYDLLHMILRQFKFQYLGSDFTCYKTVFYLLHFNIAVDGVSGLHQLGTDWNVLNFLNIITLPVLSVNVTRFSCVPDTSRAVYVCVFIAMMILQRWEKVIKLNQIKGQPWGDVR